MAALSRLGIGGTPIGRVHALPLRPARRRVLVPEVLAAEREPAAQTPPSPPSPLVEGGYETGPRWLGLLVDVYG